MEKQRSRSLKNDGETYDYELVVFDPHTVLRRVGIACDSVDGEELARTGWLWEKRPRKAFTLNRKMHTAFLVLTTILSWWAPIYATGVGTVGVVFFVLGLVDTRRQRNWCEDYNSAITRLVASAGDQNTI
jgi:hypothetical protein